MKKSFPDDDIKLICNAVIHFDKESLEKIGLIPKEYEKDIVDEIARVLTKSSELKFSESQISKIRSAILGVYKRSIFEVETISEIEDKATVKIKLSVFEKFTTETATAKLPPNIAEMSQEEQTEIITNVLVVSIDEMKIASIFDYVVECFYEPEVKMWLPVNATEFGFNIATKIWDF